MVLFAMLQITATSLSNLQQDSSFLSLFQCTSNEKLKEEITKELVTTASLQISHSL